MSRRLVPITLDNLTDLPTGCRECIYWELDPVAGRRACAAGDTGLEKEAWVSDTLLEWGSCGQLAYVDGAPAGFVLFAPAAYVPRAVAFPTSPVSPDAVLLMTARIVAEFAGSGLGRVLVQTVAREVIRRGVRAIEAFGRVGPATGGDPEREHVDYRCLLPADYLLAVGFKTVRSHPRTPRLRLDIRTTMSWREDMESALERLLGSIGGTPVLAR